MSKKFGLIILVLLVLSLSACEMSASGPPTATPPKKNNNNKVQASPTVGGQMNVVEAAATGTAAALAGIPLDSNPAPVIIDVTGTVTPLGGLPQSPDSGLPSTTPQAPAVAQPTVQTARPTTYTLKQDEFIFCLARRFNVDPAEMLALNGLWDSEIVQPGLTVRVPTSGSFPGPRALKAHPVTYTVQTGDTVYKVACLYGDVEPVNIAAVNGLEAPYTLTVGAQILIP